MTAAGSCKSASFGRHHWVWTFGESLIPLPPLLSVEKIPPYTITAVSTTTSSVCASASGCPGWGESYDLILQHPQGCSCLWPASGTASSLLLKTLPRAWGLSPLPRACTKEPQTKGARPPLWAGGGASEFLHLLGCQDLSTSLIVIAAVVSPSATAAPLSPLYFCHGFYLSKTAAFGCSIIFELDTGCWIKPNCFW